MAAGLSLCACMDKRLVGRGGPRAGGLSPALGSTDQHRLVGVGVALAAGYDTPQRDGSLPAATKGARGPTPQSRSPQGLTHRIEWLDLRSSFKALSALERTALMLTALEDLGAAEAGEILGIGANARSVRGKSRTQEAEGTTMKDRRGGSADTSEEELLRRWYVASARVERTPTTELLAGGRRFPRRHSTTRNLAVGVVAVVAVVAAAVGTGTWAGLRSSSSQTPVAMGSASAAPSIYTTPTKSPVLKDTGDGPALVTGEQVIDLGRSASGGWLLTQVRLLLDEGSSWRNCWLSGDGPGGSTPGLQAFFVDGKIKVQMSAALWTSTDDCASWSEASIPVDPVDLAFSYRECGVCHWRQSDIGGKSDHDDLQDRGRRPALEGNGHCARLCCGSLSIDIFRRR